MAGVPIYEQIREQIKNAIFGGELREMVSRLLKRGRQMLTRIFHGISTACAQEGMSTALRLFGLLDILINMPSSPSLRALCIHALIHALATKPHEISGLNALSRRFST